MCGVIFFLILLLYTHTETLYWSKKCETVMSSSTLSYLKLETIIYTSMYSVFTLHCTNGEHMINQWKSFSYTDSLSRRVTTRERCLWCFILISVSLVKSRYGALSELVSALYCGKLLMLPCEFYFCKISH